jgi:hypothetical protein
MLAESRARPAFVADNFCAICKLMAYTMRYPQRLKALLASMTSYGDSFTLSLITENTSIVCWQNLILFLSEVYIFNMSSKCAALLRVRDST